MIIGDRVKLDIAFDVDRLRADVFALPLRDFIEYSVLPLTAPGADSESARDGDAHVDYADGSWTNWVDTEILESSPYLSTIVQSFRSRTTVTCVRLLRLAPGGLVAEHTDPTLDLEVANSVIRLTIPISSNDGVVFLLNGTKVEMQPGECWYLRFSDPHTTWNAGSQERIHLSVDMIPNEWVREQIQRGYRALSA